MNRKKAARIGLFLALVLGISPLFAGVPATAVHKPTGDKIEVESGGEIEIKSGGVLDLQAGSSLGFLGVTTTLASGWPIPLVDIAVTTPAAAGLLVRTSANLVYVSTAATGVNNWIKVGAQ